MKSVHFPVLPKETISYLNIQHNGIYLDATFGGGGHSRLILEGMDSEGQLIVFDRNPAAIQLAHTWRGSLSKKRQSKVQIVEENFRYLGRELDRLQIEHLDGCFFDLGLSSDLLTSERGFSFLEDAPLDMRFDQKGALTAADLIAILNEAELADIFTRFGEESYSFRIAGAIIREREKNPITTAAQLAELILRTVGRKPGARHPATRVFQALRIVVNEELISLQEALDQAADRLNPGGRLVVISFHSLEDRLVKRFLRRRSGHCVCFKPAALCRCDIRNDLIVLTPKPIVPDVSEIKTNPRARSAKLRTAGKK